MRWMIRITTYRYDGGRIKYYIAQLLPTNNTSVCQCIWFEKIHWRRRKGSYWLLFSTEAWDRSVIIYIQWWFLLVKLDKYALGLFFRDRTLITSNCNYEFRSISITIILQQISWLIPFKQLEEVSNVLSQIFIRK